MGKKRKGGSGGEQATNGTPKKINIGSFTTVKVGTTTTDKPNTNKHTQKKQDKKQDNKQEKQNNTKQHKETDEITKIKRKERRRAKNKEKILKEEGTELEKEVFFELKANDTDLPFQNQLEAEEVEEAEPAAWVDEDDGELVHTRKVLRTEQTLVSGHEYQEKMRKRYKAIASQSDDWAKIKEKKKTTKLGNLDQLGSDESDSEEEDEILYRSQSLTSNSSRLIANTINIQLNSNAQTHQSSTRVVIIHPVEPYALSVDGHTLKVYKLDTSMILMHSVKMLDMDITDACFSVDASQIFVCGSQPSLYILEVSSGKLSFLSSILGRKEKAFSHIYASPEGKYCALLGNSGSIILISATTKQYIAELRGPSNNVFSAAFAPNGHLYASYTGGHMIIWDINARTAVHSFTNPSLASSTAIAISQCQQYLALGSTSGIVDVFLMKDVAAGGPRQPSPKVSLDNLYTSVSFIEFNHDSQLMAMGTSDKKHGLRLVHIPSFSVYQNWPTENTFTMIKDVSFSPASGFLLTGESNGKVKMFRIPHFPAA